ncbi:MAG: hypothetical protein L3J33_12425 [Rhodobacteraceae bacterium]|nr:hypothetical protein [Paracoccaceae bacterium]
MNEPKLGNLEQEERMTGLAHLFNAFEHFDKTLQSDAEIDILAMLRSCIETYSKEIDNYKSLQDFSVVQLFD